MTSKVKKGICKLCLSQSDLQDSHFLPKAAYELIQQSEGEPPVVIKPKVTMRTNEQVKDYVLCRKCEHRLNKNGERWVLEHCFRNDAGLKLMDFIGASSPVMGNGLKVYAAAGIPEVDVGKLSYFATSVTWRAAIHNWKSGKDGIRRLYLGKYTDELRRYLLEEVPFPRNAAIWVSIVPEPKLWSAVLPPYGERLDECWRYKFLFLGLSFMFFLGGRINPTIRRMCTIRSPEKFLYVGDIASEIFIRDFGGLIAKSRPVGSMSEGLYKSAESLGEGLSATIQ